MSDLPLNPVKALCDHASKDVTRIQLCGVHYDGEHFVSTDAHRLLAVRVDQMPIHIPPSQLKPGDILQTNGFKVGGIIRLDGQYPNWRQLLPAVNKTQWAFRTIIPVWLKDVKQQKKDVRSIGIDKNGDFTTGDDALCYVNPHYLAPFAGVSVDIRIIDQSSPISIIPVGATPLPWQALIMPVRRDKAIKSDVVVLKSPIKQEAM